MTEQIELRPPEQVFKGDDLPDDLKWLMTAFNLPKSDPAVVLMAWHWKRVANTQDIIKVGQMELIAALESRISKVKGFADVIQQVDANLGNVNQELAQEHLRLKTKIETELKQPLAQSLGNAVQLAAALENLLKTVQTSGVEYMGSRERTEVFLLNLANKIYFTAADKQASDMIADAIGKHTIKKRTYGRSAGKSNTSWTAQDEHWIKPHDLRALPKHRAIVKHCEQRFRKILLKPSPFTLTNTSRSEEYKLPEKHLKK